MKRLSRAGRPLVSRPRIYTAHNRIVKRSVSNYGGGSSGAGRMREIGKRLAIFTAVVATSATTLYFFGPRLLANTEDNHSNTNNERSKNSKTTSTGSTNTISTTKPTIDTKSATKDTKSTSRAASSSSSGAPSTTSNPHTPPPAGKEDEVPVKIGSDEDKHKKTLDVEHITTPGKSSSANTDAPVPAKDPSSTLKEIPLPLNQSADKDLPPLKDSSPKDPKISPDLEPITSPGRAPSLDKPPTNLNLTSKDPTTAATPSSSTSKDPTNPNPDQPNQTSTAPSSKAAADTQAAELLAQRLKEQAKQPNLVPEPIIDDVKDHSDSQTPRQKEKSKKIEAALSQAWDDWEKGISPKQVMEKELEKPANKGTKEKKKKSDDAYSSVTDLEPRLKSGYLTRKKEFENLHIELVKLQNWVRKYNKKVLVVVEGRDTAGKGGAIRNFTFHLDPRYYRVVALSKPTDVERGQWFFQRYLKELPRPGEIVFYDRSWYNRAIIEPVMGFCSDEEYTRFMRDVVYMEQMLADDGVIIIKYWFSITKDVQSLRLRDRIQDPLKQWKLSPTDWQAHVMFDAMTKFKEQMFKITSTSINPWLIVLGNDKDKARMESMRGLLASINYEGKATSQADLNENNGTINAYGHQNPTRITPYLINPGFEDVMGVQLHARE